MQDIRPAEPRPSIDLNGKFLGGVLNGVHRTAAHYCEQLIKRMAAGHEIRLLSPHASLCAEEYSHLTPTQICGQFGRGQGWEMITLPRHARSNLLLNFCNLAPLLHNNSVVMIHDAQTFLYPEDYSGKQAAAYRHLLPWIGRRARRVLTVSEFARQTLAAHGIARLEKIDVVHNGTDHLLKVAPDRSILARLTLTPRSYVLVIGTTKGYKNIRRVFEALQGGVSGDPCLVVAGGPGADAYRKKGWNPPEHTIFTGFVSDAELQALYENAAIFVFPSLTEGFGLPPVEAMHCGTPVVAAEAGAMPEVCGNGALLVEATDPRAFRTAIEAVLQDRQLRDGLIGRGRTRAGDLTWDRAGEQLETIISGLLRAQQKSPRSGSCDQL